MTKFLSLIDSGKFFTRPMRWLYVFFAILSLVPTVVVLYFLYDKGVEGVLGYLSGWAKFSGYLFCIIFALYVIVAGVLMMYYWMDRGRKVTLIVNEGDQIVAMPVWSHLVQSLMESFGVYICLVPPIGAVLFYVWGLISGFQLVNGSFDFEDYVKTLFIGIALLALVVFVCFLLSYIIILIAHYIGESIRVRAQIANDVRDLGDIHRAATILREAEEAAAEPEAKE
ncbi:MAG: hypothetical protein J5671_06410 [Bacteroidaceae bacterium]|nr:hypothetical protein [Bacteroidaceae bacterium]